MKSKFFIGNKFYRYGKDSENPEYYRLIKFEDKGPFGVYHMKRLKDGEIVKFRSDEWDQYSLTSIRPDGLIATHICYLGNENDPDDDGLKDVMVCLHKGTEKEPYAVCRQSCSDIFANTVEANKAQNVHYVGVSISRDTCPSNMKFTNVLSCKSIDESSSRIVAIYMEDKYDDIFTLFNHKKFDAVLRNLKIRCEGYKPNPQIAPLLGYNETLNELLQTNKFMYDFHACFGIVDYPFLITDEEMESTHLSKSHKEFLENKLSIKMDETYVMPYSKEIDFSNFQRAYIIINCIYNDTLYVIGYDEHSDEPMVDYKLVNQ